MDYFYVAAMKRATASPKLLPFVFHGGKSCKFWGDMGNFDR